MKNIFVVSSYPSTDKKFSILKECLRSVRKIKEFDILLTTNYPITDPEIYTLTDYIIWDKIDIQTVTEYGIFPTYGWQLIGSNFTATTSFDNAYHFDLHRALHNGVNFAKGLGYEFFYYLEGDCEILDTNNLLEKRDRMFVENKKLMFMEIDMGAYIDYATLIFGGVPDYFLDVTSGVPCQIEGWVADHNMYLYGMEVIFYRMLEGKRDSVLALKYEDFEKDANFNKIKKINSYGFRYMFFFSGDDMYLLLNNNEDKLSKIQLFLNDDPWINIDLGSSCYYHTKINPEDILDKKISEVVTFDDDIMKFEKVMSQRTIDILKQSQKIVFT